MVGPLCHSLWIIISNLQSDSLIDFFFWEQWKCNLIVHIPKEIIWQKLWIRFFFSLHQNQNIFFSNIGNRNIFFRKKNIIPPPCKLNGQSLIRCTFCISGLKRTCVFVLFISASHWTSNGRSLMSYFMNHYFKLTERLNSQCSMLKVSLNTNNTSRHVLHYTWYIVESVIKHQCNV
jgi:hypothetical protein